MKPDLTPEHQWLQQLVGNWRFEGEGSGGPDVPNHKFEGTETVKPLGDAWIIGEGRGSMPDGSPALTMITLGYDPQRQKFVGTWIGSMMTHMWHYEGALDADRKTLPLGSEGPSFSDPNATSQYVDEIEVVDANHRILRSRVQGNDGNWTTFMTAHYYRTT